MRVIAERPTGAKAQRRSPSAEKMRFECSRSGLLEILSTELATIVAFTRDQLSAFIIRLSPGTREWMWYEFCVLCILRLADVVNPYLQGRPQS